MIRIRPARVEDVPELLSMLREAAEAQGCPGEVAVTEQNLREDGFGPNPLFRALLADDGETPAGMALYFLHYSTWGSRLVLYLEDLYVRPAYRHQGVAQRLLSTLAAVATDEGCARFQWVVQKQNAAAIRLYEAFGAAPLHDWLLMSLKGERLKSAAGRRT